MNVRKIPAFASLLVPTQTARTFVAAPLVMCCDLTREHVQVIRTNLQLTNTSLAGRYITIETGYVILLLFWVGYVTKLP